MPFLSSFGGAASIGFGFSRTGGRVAAYFWNINNTAWSNSGSWYAEAEHSTESAFPTNNQTAYVLSNTEVVLDGYVTGVGSPVYHSWETLDYWSPPAGITGVGAVNITFISNEFYDADAPIPAFVDGAGDYELGDIVEYPEDEGVYYSAIRTATDTNLIDGVPDPYYWGLVGPQPYIPTNCVVNFGNDAVTLFGVNNGTPA
jgi:hypothetical protein